MDRDAALSDFFYRAAVLPPHNPPHPLVHPNQKGPTHWSLLGLVIRHANPKRAALQTAEGGSLP